MYLRDVDRVNALWECRFQWIAPSLDKENRPLVFDGEADGSGLVIDWNSKHNKDLAKLLDDRLASKADFLSNVDRLVCKLPAIEAALNMVNAADRSDLDIVVLLSLASAFEELWDDRFAAPQECQRLNQAINELLATVGNAGLIWSADQVKSRGLKSTLFLSYGYQKGITELKGDIVFLRKEVR